MTDVIFGCDIGRVVIDDAREGTIVPFAGGSLVGAKEVPDAVDALRRIAVATRGPYERCNVHLVTACERDAPDEILRWLAGHEFVVRTGIPSENVHFCRRRKEKAAVCADLGITAFVDDTLEALGRLATVRQKFLYRPDPDEAARFVDHLGSVYLADAWDDIASFLAR